MIKLFNEDCIETMKRIPDGSIDLMLTDPPYGTTACEWDVAPNLPEMWLEWERILKPNGAWIFTATQPFASLLIVSRIGLFKHVNYWNKVNAGSFVTAKFKPLSIIEEILVFGRGTVCYNPVMKKADKKNKRPRNNTYLRKNDNSNGMASGVFKSSENHNEDERYPKNLITFDNRTGELNSLDRIHPTQKPTDLMRYLILTYSNEGETVFDGYSGSGTTAIACIKEKRNFIGSEINKEYYDKATLRIKVEQMQPALF